MATKTITSPRSRATLTIFIVTALLLLAVAISQSPSLQDSVRRAIAGAESTSPDGHDQCDDWRTALAQYEANNYTHTNNTLQTFKNYANRYNFNFSADSNEGDLIDHMERYCK